MTRVRPSKAWVINGALIVLLAGAGFGIYQAFSPEQNTAEAQTRSTPVRRATVTETVSAAGTLASGYTGTANFATAGKVASIDVKVGDVVSVGQKLATIESAQAAKELQVAKANLSVARDNLDTAETAENTPSAGQNAQSTQNSVASAQAKVDQAELDVQNAQTALDNTTLHAPGAGTVTAISGTVGQQSSSGSSASSQPSTQGGNSSATTSSASSGTGFITITNMTDLVVDTSIAEIDVSKVKAGQKASVTLNSSPDKPVQATVSSVDLTPTTSGSVVSYRAKLALADPPEGLRPGQSASVVVTVAEAQNALSVPAAAVRGNVVTVQENGQNVQRRVQVGLRGESTVQITSGLTEGENVVLTATAATGTAGTGRTGGTGGFPGGGQRGTGAGGGFGGRG
ncbi:efflux RND transporter periplasmic adaptor subunit [Amycolatopsis sp. BJA-103]|uniref:efflux RND transporter periplasmic adaptor subunit n=1 Tax=Amycolatopsis sp. BJA-103 TaxID=1911175 RepID=UPI000C75B465|nr:HlyD family efflux transporter periplasmic adaptor subunit [Amycolatopsis sp. BJA-103]AUI63049.1 RND transporter [Amycolatopsis sp. BJA-103]PNE18893.1 RND transporter [Amycolatopsis sp. BJA-103]